MTPLDLTATVANWQVALPGVAVVAAAALVMVADVVGSRRDRPGLLALGVVGLAVAGAFALWLWGRGGAADGFANVLRADRFALFFTLLICAGAALTLLMAAEFLRDHDLSVGDFATLVLLTTSGMVFMVAANDLLTIFLALEVMSVGVYVLSGFLRSDVRANEAALKYFLLGAFASGFLLYGIALTWGATGTTRLDLIAQSIAQTGVTPLVGIGTALLLVGFAFKAALVPFHGWTPDVYDGAPTVVTSFMAVGVKAAAFAAFARTLSVGVGGLVEDWSAVLALLAALTMTLGNLTALAQRSVKRMLAYSSIAHAGYAAVGLVAGTRDGGAALCFYLLTYTFMNVGAFGVLLALDRRGEPHEQLGDFAGLGFRHPLLGMAMAVFMLSLAGMPPMAGFAAKFYVFKAAVESGHVSLVLIGVTNSLISIYFYLGVLVQMYMVEGEPAVLPASNRPWLVVAISIACATTLLVGLFPSGPMGFAYLAFASLR